MHEYIRAFCERGTVAQDPPGTPIPFIAGTEGIKRDGLNLLMSGGRFDSYRANPVVLWGHDYMGTRAPIGRAEIVAIGNQLRAEVVFDQEDDFARAIERKYRRGFLNAVSLGWRTLSTEGRDVTEWDLLDISAVPVPGDPSALIQRQTRAQTDLLIDEPEAQPVGQSWELTAAEMVRLYNDQTPYTERERKARYNHLSRLYRLASKTEPEYRTSDQLAGLGPDELRGLFLAGESELWPELFPETRAGAMLSSRNKADLTEAMRLIRSVLDRAMKEEDMPMNDEDDEERSVSPDIELSAEETTLRTISDALRQWNIGAS